MIILDIDNEKVLTIALVPYLPDDNTIQMTAGVEGDFDKIKIIPQLQILRKKDLTVIESAMITPDELKKLMHLGRAVGLTLEAMANTLDKNFDEYRKLARRKE